MSDTFSAKPNYIRFDILNVKGELNTYQFSYDIINDTWNLDGLYDSSIPALYSLNDSNYIEPSINYTINNGILTGNIITDVFCKRDEDFPTFDIDFDAFLIGKPRINTDDSNTNYNPSVCCTNLPVGIGTLNQINSYEYNNSGYGTIFYGEYKYGDVNNKDTFGEGYKLTYNNKKYQTSSINYCRPYKIPNNIDLNFETISRCCKLCFNSYVDWKEYYDKLSEYISNPNIDYSLNYGIGIDNNNFIEIIDSENNNLNKFKESIGYNADNQSINLPICVLYYATCKSTHNNISEYTYYTNITSDMVGYCPNMMDDDSYDIILDNWDISGDIKDLTYKKDNFKKVIDVFTGSSIRCTQGSDIVKLNEEIYSTLGCDSFNITTDQYFSNLVNNVNNYSKNFTTHFATNKKPIEESAWHEVLSYGALPHDGTYDYIHQIELEIYMIQKQWNHDGKTRYTVVSKTINYEINSTRNTYSNLRLDWPVSIYHSVSNRNFAYNTGLCNTYNKTGMDKFNAGIVYPVYESCEPVLVWLDSDTSLDCLSTLHENCKPAYRSGVIYINPILGKYASCNCTTNVDCLDGYAGLHYVNSDTEYRQHCEGFDLLEWNTLTPEKQSEIESWACSGDVPIDPNEYKLLTIHSDVPSICDSESQEEIEQEMEESVSQMQTNYYVNGSRVSGDIIDGGTINTLTYKNPEVE